MPDIDALTIQVDGLSEAAEKSIQKLSDALKKLERSASGGAGLEAVENKLSSIQAQINKINTGKFGDLVKQLERLNKTKIDGTLSKSLGNIANTTRSVNNSLGNTAIRMGIMGISLRTVVNTLASFMKESMNYMENMNLFTVSMGKYADEAKEYANAVSEVMGIDISTWVRNQGVFMSLAEGFGVVSDRAYKMSKNLTQLGYDLSSFYNISYEDAFQKLQSGISGELEPLRRLGVDLSEARLKAIAFELGITKVYSAMTQAEKAQLRYHAIMTQTTKAQGDMARTLDAPSNQLRVLKAAATQAARAIGNTFIPILNAILPYAIAAANAIRIIASAFAALVGFTMPSVDYSGVSGAADAAGKLNENLGGAGGSAKELQKILMGFDEINKIPDASGGGGGGGGGALDGFDFDLLEYDFLGETVNSRVQQIMHKFAPALEFIKNNASDILQIAKAAGIAFLEWKVASKFLPDLRTGRNIVNTIKNTLLGLTIGVITIGLSFKFTQDFMENSTDGNLDWGSLISSGLTSAFGSGMTGLVISKATDNKALGWVATGATLTISALTDLSLQYNDVVNGGGWDADNTATAIKNMLELAIGGGALGFAIGGLPGAGIGAIAGLVISFASTLLLTIKSAKVKKDQKAMGMAKVGIHLQQMEIEEFIKEQMQFDTKAQIEILDAAAELSQTAKDNLKKSIGDFIGTMDLIKLGVDAPNSTKTAIEQLTGAGGVLARIQEQLGHEENYLKALIKFAPPVSEGEDANYAADLYSAYENASDSMYIVIDTLGNTLASLLTESLERELTAKEQELVQSITSTIATVNQQVALQSAAAGFYETINQINWADLDDESYIAAIDTLKTSYSNAIDAVRTSYEKEFASFQAMLAYWDTVKSTAEDALNYKIEVGDTEGVAALNAEIEAADQNMQHFKALIESFDMDGTLKNFSDSLLGSVSIDDILATTYERFPELIGEMQRELEEQGTLKINIEPKFVDPDFGLLSSFGISGSSVASQTYESTSKVRKTISNLYDLFGWDVFEYGAGGGSSGGGGSPLIKQAETAATEAAEAFTTAFETGVAEVDTVIPDAFNAGFASMSLLMNGVQKNIKTLGNDNTFSDFRNQLALTQADAQGISTAINEIPAHRSIALNIPGYSTIINRINNIATRIKSITSGNVNIKVKAGVDSGSKQFLMQLAQVSPTSTLAGQLMELIELSAFAKGGFPRRGDLFIANENGPELVGRIGNKTAVANEDQIGDTILSYMEQVDGGGSGSMDEERLATVLVRAMKNAGLGALRIDGKDIIRSINRETQRTGHTPITIK